jgi:hypothetical protein
VGSASKIRPFCLGLVRCNAQSICNEIIDLAGAFYNLSTVFQTRISFERDFGYTREVIWKLRERWGP